MSIFQAIESAAVYYDEIDQKAMALHSSTLAWQIPWTEEPGGLPSIGLHRVGQDCSDLAAAAYHIIQQTYQLHYQKMYIQQVLIKQGNIEIQ